MPARSHRSPIARHASSRVGRREFLAGVFACAVTPAAGARGSGDAPDAEWPLRRDPEGRPLVPVTIDGRGPWDFVVDSAATRTLVTPDVAAELGLAVSATPGLEVRGTTGSVRLPIARIGGLHSGNARLAEADVAVLPRFVLAAGGILGVDALARSVLDLDFVAARCAIRARVPALRRAVSIRAARRLAGAIAVTASVEGASVLAVVDTGAGRTLGNAALARLLPTSARAPAGSVRGVDRALATSAPCAPLSIEVGRETLSLPAATCADAAAFSHWNAADTPALLLGMDALALFDRVAIDFARGTMHLGRRSAAAG